MPIANSYLDAIRRFEGWNPRPYWDHKQWSIGYGTRGRPGETIDRAEGERRLNTELTGARDSVRRMGVGMSPGREAALTSLTYNAGPGWQNSGLGRSVREGNWDDARRRFLQYTNASGSPNRGLINRRNAEAEWLNDVSGPMGVPHMPDLGVVDPMNPEMEPTGPALPPAAASGPQPSSGPPSVTTPQSMPYGPPQQGEQQGGYLANLTNNPMLMAGLSILGTAPGQSWGPAAAQAIDRAQTGQIRQEEYRRLTNRRRQSESVWNAAFPNGQANPEHPLLRGIPPDLLGVVQALGPDEGLPTLQRYALTRSTRGLQEDLQRAQIQYYNARSQSTVQRGQAAEMNADTRRRVANFDSFISRFGSGDVTEAQWEEENREGGLIPAVFGRTIPFTERNSAVQQVQSQRDQLQGGENEPSAEELRAAGVRPEDAARRRQQTTLERMYGSPPRNHRWRTDGTTEPIPGYGTQGERQAQTTATQGLAMLTEAEKILGETGTLEALRGDRWFTRPDGTGGVGGFGAAGRGYLAARGAITNLVFALSGKQVSNAERQTFMSIYSPTSLDSKETQNWKLKQVRNFFEAVLAARQNGADDDAVAEMLRRATAEGEAGPTPQSRAPAAPRSGGGREDPLGIR